jgi:hypothetical protein
MGSGAQGAHVTIPSVMISQRSCDTLKLYLSNLNVSLNANLGPSFDSGLDNGIIAHEYGHGLTKRLTGGAGNSTCLSNEEQMGEGWSDYLSLIFTAKTSDMSIKKRGIGTYLINQPTDGNGIRPYPYTTDMTLNPMTYGNIKTLTAPHHLGSVWCTMLWDMTWLFQDIYGFSEDLYQGDGGNNMALALIVEALKLQPCQPGFVTGRNAILKADSLINGGAHSCLIWKAFARRGLGASASQGSAYDKNDGVEAFDMPITCRNIVTSTDHIGVGSLRYGIENAMSGDTIKFAPYLEGKDFDLIADPIIINKNLALINSFESNLLLNFSEHGMFEISVGSNVLLDGVKFFKSNSLNPFISNNGSLTLKNVTVGGTQSVINAGTIKVIGQTDIKN